MRTLVQLKIGERGRVKRVQAETGALRRLMDLGFTPGAWAQARLAAPFRGMRAYQVRGAVIALRKKDAERVILEEESHG